MSAGGLGGIPLAQGFIVSDPNSDELVDVVVPAFDDAQKFNDCPYMPRGDQAPEIGARCLVAFDDHGAAWVVAWHQT